MQDRDNLDLLLDSALADYVDPGPDSGLEQRVLSALAAEREAGEMRTAAPWRRRWLPWAIAIPLAASLLLWIGIAQFRQGASDRQQQASRSRPSPTSQDSHLASGSRPSNPGQRREEAHVLKGGDVSRAAIGSESRRTLAPRGRDLEVTSVKNPGPSPKLAVFPSPQPLTPEEHVLIAAATRGSDAQRTALLEAAKPPSDAPLAIADLSIPPLVPPDDGTKLK